MKSLSLRNTATVAYYNSTCHHRYLVHTSVLFFSCWLISKNKNHKRELVPTGVRLVVYWRAKHLHVDGIAGRRVWCCVQVLLKLSNAANVCHSRLVWNSLSAAQTRTRLFLQQRDIKKESAAQSMRTIYIYIWKGFHSLSAFKEQPRVTTAHVWVFGERVNDGWLGLRDSPGGTWGPHLPLSNYPKTCTCKMDFNLTKTP